MRRQNGFSGKVHARAQRVGSLVCGEKACCLSQGDRSKQPPKSQICYTEEEVGRVRKEGMKSELKQNPVVVFWSATAGGGKRE